MRQAVAAILTLALIGAVLVLTRRPNASRVQVSAEAPTGQASPTAEVDSTADAKQTVLGMIDATQKTDLKAYLNYFRGDLRARMENTIGTDGKEAFLDSLRRTNEQTVGVAILGSETLDSNRCRIKVDLVFRDGHQEQMYEVERYRGKWFIVAIKGGPRQKSAMPYGSEVGPLVLPSPTPTGQSGETGLAP